MKTLEAKPGKKPGTRIVTVELANNEAVIAVNADAFYRLGYPLEDDVITGRQLVDSARVAWCIIEQKWVS